MNHGFSSKNNEDFIDEEIVINNEKFNLYYGLNFKYYSHFTSPIRRYPDLIVHRIISNSIDSVDSISAIYDEQTMLSLATHCSNAERRAEDASRDAIQRLKCNFMKDKEGKKWIL